MIERKLPKLSPTNIPRQKQAKKKINFLLAAALIIILSAAATGAKFFWDIESLRSENQKMRETGGYHFQLASEYMALGKWDEAKDELTIVIEDYSSHASVAAAKACRKQVEKKLEKQENERAKEKALVLKEKANLTATAAYHYQNGLELFCGKKFKEAINEFRAVIDKFPDSPLAGPAGEHLISARAEYIFSENKRAERKLLVERDNQKLKDSAEYHYRMGIECMTRDQIESAKKEFETVIYDYPKSALTKAARDHLNMAEIELSKYNYYKAKGKNEPRWFAKPPEGNKLPEKPKEMDKELEEIIGDTGQGSAN